MARQKSWFFALVLFPSLALAEMVQHEITPMPEMEPARPILPQPPTQPDRYAQFLEAANSCFMGRPQAPYTPSMPEQVPAPETMAVAPIAASTR